MSDLRPTIVPKSDQMNADDLIGCTVTIKITSVSVRVDEQPVSIHYEGDNGKPYKPGKSMRRVLVNVWGHDSNNYIGRSLTLYRDEKVQFGGLAVGGIRISHMSDIPKEMTMALTMSRANKKPFVVRPLVAEKAPTEARAPTAANRSAPAQDDPETVKLVDDLVEMFDGSIDAADHAELVAANAAQFAWLKQKAPRLWQTKVEPAVNSSKLRHTIIEPAPPQPPGDPATDPLMASTLEMVQHINARNRETHPALLASGKYTRLIDDLEASGRLDLMNRIRDANAAALLREAEAVS